MPVQRLILLMGGATLGRTVLFPLVLAASPGTSHSPAAVAAAGLRGLLRHRRAADLLISRQAPSA